MMDKYPDEPAENANRLRFDINFVLLVIFVLSTAYVLSR